LLMGLPFFEYSSGCIGALPRPLQGCTLLLKSWTERWLIRVAPHTTQNRLAQPAGGTTGAASNLGARVPANLFGALAKRCCARWGGGRIFRPYTTQMAVSHQEAGAMHFRSKQSRRSEPVLKGLACLNCHRLAFAVVLATDHHLYLRCSHCGQPLTIPERRTAPRP
jgi:hypothetical protein